MPCRKYLKAGGLVLPDQAALMVVGVEDREALATAKDAWARAAGPGLDMAAAMSQVGFASGRVHRLAWCWLHGADDVLLSGGSGAPCAHSHMTLLV